MAGPERSQASYAAMGGVLAAGSLAVLWLACAAPSGRIGLTAAAGLFPVAATLYAGRAAGYLCWASSALLGLFLLPDKGVAALYLAFLGVYPVAKGRIESLNRPGLEWGLKLCWFEMTLTLFWFVFQELFLPEAPAWLASNAVLVYVLGGMVFICYDIGLSQLITLLRTRLYRAKGH